MNEFNELDHMFQEQLKNAQMQPPPGVWESVATSVSSTATTTGAAGVWLSVAKWLSLGIAVSGISWLAYRAINNSTAENKAVNTATKTAENQQIPAKDLGTNGNENAAETKKTAPSTPHTQQKNVANPAASSNPNQNGQPEVNAASQTYPVHNPENKNHPNNPANITSPAQKTVSGKSNSPTPGERYVCPHALRIQVVKMGDGSYSIQALGAISNVNWWVNDGLGQNYTGDYFTYRMPIAQTEDVKVLARTQTENGCRDSAYYVISADPADPEIFDYLTPNGDGYNDSYLPLFPSPPAYFDMSIYDLNKRQVFHSDNFTAGWNGTCATNPCTPGKYQLVLVYKLKSNAKPKTVIRFIELIR
jgi:gliding motility-associated-like protein